MDYFFWDGGWHKPTEKLVQTDRNLFFGMFSSIGAATVKHLFFGMFSSIAAATVKIVHIYGWSAYFVFLPKAHTSPTRRGDAPG
jgi:hypothetical protein